MRANHFAKLYNEPSSPAARTSGVQDDDAREPKKYPLENIFPLYREIIDFSRNFYIKYQDEYLHDKTPISERGESLSRFPNTNVETSSSSCESLFPFCKRSTSQKRKEKKKKKKIALDLQLRKFIECQIGNMYFRGVK